MPVRAAPHDDGRGPPVRRPRTGPEPDRGGDRRTTYDARHVRAPGSRRRSGNVRVSVVDASDRRWRVRRRWLPWRRRVREVPDVPFDGGDLGDDPISALIGLFLLVLALPAIIMVVAILVELLVLLALLPAFVLVRLLLPVPWKIELWARPASRRVLGWHLQHEVPVRGWRASGERIAEMTAEIREQGPGRRYVPREVLAKAEADGSTERIDETWPDRAADDRSRTAGRAADARSGDRTPGDAAPPVEPGADVATGSPYGAAPVRPAGGTAAGRPASGTASPDGSMPNPFAQRDED